MTTGVDFSALNTSAGDAMVALAKEPERRRAIAALHVVPAYDQELSIAIDDDRAAELGVELSAIGVTLGAALRGIDVASRMLIRPTSSTTPRIVVRVPVDVDHLGDLTVRSRRLGRSSPCTR